MTWVQAAVADHVAVLTLARPPVNSLDRALREELTRSLNAALADPTVHAVVLTGGSGQFSAGADIREFAAGLAGAAFHAPGLGAVCDLIANAHKPVVAAIAGTCMGGGLELALACTKRVATTSAKLALPEIRLGLIPGAGGTQRLPRLIGVPAALRLILSGETIGAKAAADLGLVELVEADVVSAAVKVAKEALGATHSGEGVLATAVDDDAARGALASASKPGGPSSPAQVAAVTAVRSSLELPLDNGLRVETRLFRELMQTPEARALQYGFFADRTAAHIEGLAGGTNPRDIRRVVIVGAGTMGVGIAICAASAGLETHVVDSSSTSLDRARQRIGDTYMGGVRKGRWSEPEARRMIDGIALASTLDAARDADLVIEAVPESLELKRDVFMRLDAITRPGSVLATNTSTLDVAQIASATKRPGDVVGLHFFSPANVMRLLEVVRADATSDAVVATAMAFAKRIGKVAVLARVCDGFIGNRMFEEYCRQAGFLLDEGALPSQVDRALEAWGMAMGPFAVLDLAGGDIAWAIRKRRALEQPDRPYSKLPDLVCELGRLGQKTGAGYYRYDPATRKREADPEIDALVIRHSADIGMQRRDISDEEIVARCVLALVNEGARLLDDGIAQRASDIDVVYRHGYGFPAARGGPMFYADECGLSAVLAEMRRFSAGYGGSFWNAATLIERCASEKTRLSDAAAPAHR